MSAVIENRPPPAATSGIDCDTLSEIFAVSRDHNSRATLVGMSAVHAVQLEAIAGYIRSVEEGVAAIAAPRWSESLGTAVANAFTVAVQLPISQVKADIAALRHAQESAAGHLQALDQRQTAMVRHLEELRAAVGRLGAELALAEDLTEAAIATVASDLEAQIVESRQDQEGKAQKSAPPRPAGKK